MTEHHARAGFVSRLLAALVDVGLIWLIDLAFLLTAGVARYLFSGPPFDLPKMPLWLAFTGGGALGIAYFTLGWAVSGRTPGMQVLGLRVVDSAGDIPSFPRALVRAVCAVLVPVGLAWTLVSKRNFALSDILAHTSVIYDVTRHVPVIRAPVTRAGMD